MPAKLPQRKIGDANVSAIGLGCMGMSYGYPAAGGYDDNESLNVLTRAADIGVTFWDSSDFYGPHTNEQLLGKWFKETGRRKEIFLATKFGAHIKDGKPAVRGDREYVHAALEDSLKRLGLDSVDLYYQHRVDTKTPIEVTVKAMVELKEQGKIKYLGLSECSATTLRRACMVHPIAAVQMEYSPFALEIESDQTALLKTAREFGVKVIPYSPLGRGFLTGAIKSRDDFEEKDIRLTHPRFTGENFVANLKLVESLSAMAEKKGCTPGQLTLAWVLAQGDDFIPIPGTKRIKYLEENAAAANVNLTKEEVQAFRNEVEKVGGSKGLRYPEPVMATLFADTPEL